MKKREFLARLRKSLRGLPKNDVEERLTFYGEMIDDGIEDGLSEEDAVSRIGSVDEIARQIIADIPLAKIAKERIKPKRKLSAGEIALLAVGSPIWLSLMLAAVAAIFAVYVSLWSVIVALWATFGSFAACAVAGVPTMIIFAAGGKTLPGLAILAAGLVCAGLSVFAFYGCKAITKVILLFTKEIAIRIKKCFIGKEEA